MDKRYPSRNRFETQLTWMPENTNDDVEAWHRLAGALFRLRVGFWGCKILQTITSNAETWTIHDVSWPHWISSILPDIMIHQMNQVGQNLGHHFGDPFDSSTSTFPCVVAVTTPFLFDIFRAALAVVQPPGKTHLSTSWFPGGSTHTSLCYDFIMIYTSYHVSPSFPMSLPESVHVQQATRSATSKTRSHCLAQPSTRPAWRSKHVL